MKKIITIMATLILTAGFLLAGYGRAEAMHGGPAVVFSGSLTFVEQPVTRVVEKRIVYSGEQYVTYPAYYSRGYPSDRYVERTKIIIVKPGHRGWDHRRGHHEQWCRHDHDWRWDRWHRHDGWD
ncbi:MAG: hypothetical protein HZA16_05985 [Nitrospirae bacterium]|nr:hypothetical protein [Nitrospirota bacterium]